LIVAGIGCRTGVSSEAVVALVTHAAEGRRIDALAVPVFRQHESGIAEAARALDLPITWIDHAALKGEQGRCQTRSARAETEVGLSCVAEAAALFAAGPQSRLVLPRIVGGGVTCALAASA
jgi:cobalt-precorrin 5A hydrolase